MDPFVAEIRIFPFNFAPKGWAFCNGQLLDLSMNTALFSLLGTNYGGNGKSTFALPDMQGNAPMHAGDGAGLSQRFLAETSGSPTVTLIESEIPTHTHNFQVSAPPLSTHATSSDPTNNLLANGAWNTGTLGGVIATYTAASGNPPLVALDPQALSITGSSFPHENMQPYLTLKFCIALQGIFPARP